jgi:hypothetical protein
MEALHLHDAGRDERIAFGVLCDGDDTLVPGRSLSASARTAASPKQRARRASAVP